MKKELNNVWMNFHQLAAKNLNVSAVQRSIASAIWYSIGKKKIIVPYSLFDWPKSGFVRAKKYLAGHHDRWPAVCYFEPCHLCSLKIYKEFNFILVRSITIHLVYGIKLRLGQRSVVSGPRWQFIVYSDHRLVFFWRTWLNSPWKSLNGQHKSTIFQVTHLKLDAESLCQKRLAHLIDSAKITAFGSRLQTTDWSLSITLTLPMIPTTHSLVLLISEYHKSFPLKPVYTESRHSSKPWFSKGLFVSCNRKNSPNKPYWIQQI